MRRFLVVSMVCVMALAIAAPTFALEVKFGGLWRTRLISQHDFVNATAGETRDNTDQFSSVPYMKHANRIDQRLRIYMDFISSENLKVVTRFETNASWGAAGRTNPDRVVTSSGSGNIGADSGALVVKNAYVDFKIPQTPLQAKIGVQGLDLLDGWLVNDDFSAATLTADLKPFNVMLGYIAGYNQDDMTETENIDDLLAVVSYKEGPFSASLMGLWQDAHDNGGSVFPMMMSTPYRVIDTVGGTVKDPLGNTWLVENNQLFNLGLNLRYKIDYLSAYFNFIKNFGSVKLGDRRDQMESFDYTGWMLDGGINYFCGPWSFNLGGFYTTGQKYTNLVNDEGEITFDKGTDLDWFTYAMAGPSKVFSEIVGGGLFDNYIPNGGFWMGYPNPTNIWTVNAGAAWQALPKTKLALAWYYFGTSEKVPSRINPNGTVDFDNYLGNEINLNITQNIVDKLNLDLVGAYMFTGDAYRLKNANSPHDHSDSVYELGARLQWTW